MSARPAFGENNRSGFDTSSNYDPFERFKNDIRRDRSFPGTSPKGEFRARFDSHPGNLGSSSPGVRRFGADSPPISRGFPARDGRSSNSSGGDSQEELFGNQYRPPRENILDQLKDKLRKSDMFFHTAPEFDWNQDPMARRKADESEDWARKSFDEMRNRNPTFRMPNWMEDDDVSNLASRMSHTPFGQPRGGEERGPWRERRSSGGSNMSATSEDDSVDGPFVDRLSQGSGGSTGSGGVFIPPHSDAHVQKIPIRIEAMAPPGAEPSMQPKVQPQEPVMQPNEKADRDCSSDQQNVMPPKGKQPLCATRTTSTIESSGQDQVPRNTRSSSAPPEMAESDQAGTSPQNRKFISKINIIPQVSNTVPNIPQKFNNVAKPFVPHKMNSPKPIAEEQPMEQQLGDTLNQSQPQAPPQQQMPQQQQNLQQESSYPEQTDNQQTGESSPPNFQDEQEPPPSRHKGSIVRNIPIFFEGRDEPFINKAAPGKSPPQPQQRQAPVQPQQHQAPPQRQVPPQRQAPPQRQVPPQRQAPPQRQVPQQRQAPQQRQTSQPQGPPPPEQFESSSPSGSQWNPFMRPEFSSRGFGFPMEDRYRGMFDDDQDYFRNQRPFSKPDPAQQRPNPTQPQPPPPPPPPPPQQQKQATPGTVPVNIQRQAPAPAPAPAAAPAPAPAPTPAPKEEEKPKAPPGPPKDIKLEKIARARIVYEDLKDKVDQFVGETRNKEFLYLDEMLTRNLIQLDDIDPDGREDVRQTRRALIKDINSTISFLEKKVADVEAAKKNEPQTPEASQTSVDESSPMEVEEGADKSQPEPSSDCGKPEEETPVIASKPETPIVATKREDPIEVESQMEFDQIEKDCESIIDQVNEEVKKSEEKERSSTPSVKTSDPVSESSEPQNMEATS